MADDRTDQELIAAANRGEAAAMEALYYRHRAWVLATASRYCSPADAEDVLQEVFRYFFGKFPGFTLTCQLRTFLFPAIRNRCLDLLKKQRRQEILPETVAQDLPDQAGPSEREARRALAEVAADLPPEQREIVLLRFGEGWKLDEIADRLGIPAGTVKSRLHLALQALRRQLEAD